MDVGRHSRGITLLELMVVIVLMAIISGIVGPTIANRLETLTLRTTATQLAAQFKKAQAQARVSQTMVGAVYSEHEFRFLQGQKQIGSFLLPDSISPSFDNGNDTFILFPSGQIAGPERLQLVDQSGKKAVIELNFLQGIKAPGL